ncbi:arylsulfatase [Flavivirga amylovorans]|uniref:Arylsulfatase n=1 Tax=Flavivirga amylovorans TaxID=870486 RepID=A0ABT8WWX4_9FLAO|nr:arylsulfatase [Flavivirga amylovorans]MDO5986176.1 arylsulfatase [Flavivirga amylovorans]
MQKHNLINIFIWVLVLSVFSCNTNKNKKDNNEQSKNTVQVEKGKPNIIYILADDLGYGDLGCYGQQKIETPNIDALAKNGIKFTQHYSGSTVCAPSRSSLMTGQHTGHTPIRGNRELKGQEGQTPLPASSITIAEILKDQGYATGAFGKWGLGFIGSDGDAVNQGFDEFYGYNCQRVAHRYYPTYLWRNQDKEFLEGNDWTNTVTYAPDKIHEEALSFIEKNKDQPFFAYVPLIQPHAELISPKDSILQKYLGKFEETPFRDKKTSDYGPDLEVSGYCSQETPLAVFASMVSRIDNYVGEIVAKVKALGIEDNTIIMFTSDNGPHVEGGAEPEFFDSTGGLRGVKRDLYEGGIRAPFIVSWPGTIKAAQTSDHISAFWDVMPTVADITGAETPTSSDGISFLPTLLAENNQKQHDYLYWEFNNRGGRKAIRQGKWKGVWYNIHKNNGGKFELFDLSIDKKEIHDIASEHPEMVEKLKQLIKNSHTPSELFPFDK